MKIVSFYFFILILSIISFSCSNFSYNNVYENDFYLRGGKIGGKTWNDLLHFKRVSWYAGSTLLYDLYYTTLEEGSPFFAWPSADETRDLKSCQKHFIFLAHELDTLRISHQDVEKFIENAGFNRLNLTTFSNVIKTHPDFRRRFFQSYVISGRCSKSAHNNSISISLPNFDPIVISQ